MLWERRGLFSGRLGGLMLRLLPSPLNPLTLSQKEETLLSSAPGSYVKSPCVGLVLWWFSLVEKVRFLTTLSKKQDSGFQVCKWARYPTSPCSVVTKPDQNTLPFQVWVFLSWGFPLAAKPIISTARACRAWAPGALPPDEVRLLPAGTHPSHPLAKARRLVAGSCTGEHPLTHGFPTWTQIYLQGEVRKL